MRAPRLTPKRRAWLATLDVGARALHQSAFDGLPPAETRITWRGPNGHLTTGISQVRIRRYNPDGTERLTERGQIISWLLPCETEGS